MIDKTHALPVAAQCRLLDISRGCVYYRPVPVSPADLQLMRRLDELHLEHPTFGSRRLLVVLQREGFDVGQQHVCTLMNRMDIEAIYRKPRTSLRNQAHPVYPYLLKDVAIERPNQAWAADITYIPMARGFGYLVAIQERRHHPRQPTRSSTEPSTAVRPPYFGLHLFKKPEPPLCTILPWSCKAMQRGVDEC